jgi:hypothetical protein
MVRRLSSGEVADRIFSHTAQSSANAEESGAALRAVCTELDRGLSSVVGEMGFQAMFTRSVRKATAAFPALRHLDVSDRVSVLNELLPLLLREDASVTRAVGVAVVASLLELLSTLIGDDLAFRLFRDTFPEALSYAPDPAEKP